MSILDLTNYPGNYCFLLSNLILFQDDYMMFSGALTSYFVSSGQAHYYVLSVAFPQCNFFSVSI